MGRGPGPTSSTIGFNVSAVSDDNDGQQPVQILRDGTNVSSNATAQNLGTFNQLPNFPPLVSKNGNTVLITGTNVVNPIIGGILPVGTDNVQPAIKITAMNFSSPLVTNYGYAMSGTAGTNGGSISFSEVYNTANTELILGAKITYDGDVTAAGKPKFFDNGAAPTDVGEAPSAVNDSDTIGLGTYQGGWHRTWINVQVRGTTTKKYNMQSGAEISVDITWEPAADVLLYASIDAMMGTTYAAGGGGTVGISVKSLPPLNNPDAATVRGVAPDTNGKQVSYTDQTAGGGTGDDTLTTGNLYDFNVGGGDINVVVPTYNWGGAAITDGQLFGVKSTGIFANYSLDQVTEISGANTYAADSSVPAAQAFSLHKTNGNSETGEGLMSVAYSVGGALISAPTDGNGNPTPATAGVTYSSAIAIGTVVANNDSSQSGCDEMETVDEDNGSAQFTVSGGFEGLDLSLTLDASYT